MAASFKLGLAASLLPFVLSEGGNESNVTQSLPVNRVSEDEQELLWVDFLNYMPYEVLSIEVGKVFLLFIWWNVIGSQVSSLFKFVCPPYVNYRRLSDSFWRLLYHCTTSVVSLYLLNSLDKPVIGNPSLAWEAPYARSTSVPKVVELFHLVQISYYLYVLCDVMKESASLRHAFAQGIRNTVLFMLIVLVYVLRYYDVGFMIFLLHDVVGIFTEFSKATTYLERLSNRFKKAAYWSFLLYTLCFSVLTFFWFPRNVVFWSFYVTLTRLDQPLVEVITFTIGVLEVVNLYWWWVLIHWAKVLIEKHSTSKRSILYLFLHKGIPLGGKKSSSSPKMSRSSKSTKVGGKSHPSQTSLIASPHRSPPPLVTGWRTEDARALLQTVRCGIQLKRKLKRLRAAKAAETDRLEDVAENEQSRDIVSAATSDSVTIDDGPAVSVRDVAEQACDADSDEIVSVASVRIRDDDDDAHSSGHSADTSRGCSVGKTSLEDDDPHFGSPSPTSSKGSGGQPAGDDASSGSEFEVALEVDDDRLSTTKVRY